MIDPRLLRTFLTVCRAGSISAAARELQIAQPSVSVAVRQLERGLKTELLVRGPKQATPTAAGAALLRRAEMMDVLLRDAEEAVALASQGIAGPLRIGGTPGALVSLVPAALAAMASDQRITVHVIERSDAQLTEELRRGDIEFAVMTTGIDPVPDDLEERSIAQDPFALVVGRAHAGLGPTVSLRKLGAFGWVLPRAAGAFHRQIDALFQAADAPKPSDVIRCDSLLTSKEIVRRGRRVTLLPRGVVAPEMAAGMLRAIPIEGAEIRRNVGIRTLRGRATSAIGAAFLAALTANAARL
jgi:DNA-binding transcriptional LysR family regulator